MNNISLSWRYVSVQMNVNGTCWEVYFNLVAFNYGIMTRTHNRPHLSTETGLEMRYQQALVNIRIFKHKDWQSPLSFTKVCIIDKVYNLSPPNSAHDPPSRHQIARCWLKYLEYILRHTRCLNCLIIFSIADSKVSIHHRIENNGLLLSLSLMRSNLPL